jgi:hypothetical protein
MTAARWRRALLRADGAARADVRRRRRRRLSDCAAAHVSPRACLGRYEIATGKTTVWPHVAAGATYVTVSAMDGEGGGVRCKAWGLGETWMRIHARDAAPAKSDPSKVLGTKPAT